MTTLKREAGLNVITTKHIIRHSLLTVVLSLLLLLQLPTAFATPIDSRTTTTTYDARGQFAVSTTNALGHSESHVFDNRYGVMTSMTGPNGLTTSWAYDTFGRKVSETRADGTTSTITREWCDGFLGFTGNPNCPTGGALAITTESDGSTTTAAFSDALGRVLRSASVGRSGQLIYSDTVYDDKGQITHQSKSYFVGDAILWSQLFYDEVGRIYREISADGSQNNTGFNGLSTTIVNSIGQINERTKNILGNVVQVYDADANDTFYRYDAFGNLIETEDADGNTINNTYDIRGRKIAMSDPDMGDWSYDYNALGELVSQTDAKGQVVTMTYDILGRMLSRVEMEGISTWTYDTASNGIGKLHNATGSEGDSKTLSYDSLGRATSVTSLIEDNAYTVATSYDSYSRISSMTYPSSTQAPLGLVVDYVYTTAAIDGADGFLSTVTNPSNGIVYWQANSQNAAGQLTEIQLGNGITTQYDYSATTNLISTIKSYTQGNQSLVDIQHLGFNFDSIGNLTQRSDYNQYSGLTALNEQFSFDNLNRMTASHVYQQSYKDYHYDALGNITSKTGIGFYSYGNNAGPHAVTQTNLNGILTSYAYDANGNMVSGNNRSIAYNSYNKPTRMMTATADIAFSYGADRARTIRRNLITGKTRLYIGNLFEKETHNSLTTYTHFIKAGGSTVAIVTSKSDSSGHTRYLHKDHLGSITTITDEQGLITEQQSYDPHGKRRNSDWTDIITASNTTPASVTTDRGYTGHEHIDEVGLIHMNGRVYDPNLGRFISADPYIQAPLNSQSLNRYSYVMNNPLSYTDPSGFWSFGKKLFKSIKRAFKSIHKAVKQIYLGSLTKFISKLGDKVLVGLAKVPFLNAIVQAVGCFYSGPACPQFLAAYNARQTYAVTGDLRLAFRAGITAYASAQLFGYTEFTGWKETLIYAVSAQEPRAGAALNFAFNGGIDINSITKSASAFATVVKSYYVGQAVGHLAKKVGLTTTEFNVILGLNSYLGKVVAGTTYTRKNGRITIDGFFSRKKRAYSGVIWDVNDTILGYQGLIDSVGRDYINDGGGAHIDQGHSLGALRASNLVAGGFAKSANIYALPFGNSAPANVNVTLGAGDPVNGGLLGAIFNPNARIETREFGCGLHAMKCYAGGL